MTISISDSAKSRISTICAGAHFRIGVGGGSCQGFKYVFEVEAQVGAEDEVFDFDGVSLVVDKVSLRFLLGSRLDYVSSLVEERFEIFNPNATSTCGCGTSFSV